MTTIRIVGIAVLAICACGFAQAETSDRDVQAEVQRKIRFEYAKSADYNPYANGLSEIKRSSGEFLEDGKFDKAIHEAEKGLSIDRLNIDLLITIAAAYRGKGNIAKGDEYRKRWMSLVDSIVDRRQGDGKSYATAFKVISVDEEYAVLRVFHLERVRQILVTDGGSEYDILSVKNDKSEEEFDLYFNIDLPKKWLERRLSSETKGAPSHTAEPVSPSRAGSP